MGWLLKINDMIKRLYCEKCVTEDWCNANRCGVGYIEELSKKPNGVRNEKIKTLITIFLLSFLEVILVTVFIIIIFLFIINII